MKKTFTISISDTIFHIDEDAYEVLKKYMVNIKEHFHNTEDGKEIVSDIEYRLSELFTEKNDDNVITLEKVGNVIEIMGQPEIFDEENDVVIPEKIKRRLYRDPEHKIISGVCGGIAAYFETDPTIVRIITILLSFISFGAIFIAYIILWVIVKKAETTTQKLEMRGENVTVKNIEKFIKETINKINN